MVPPVPPLKIRRGSVSWGSIRVVDPHHLTVDFITIPHLEPPGGRPLEKHAEVARSMKDYVSDYLDESWQDDRDPENNWQPSDLLPELDGEGWKGRLHEIRERAQTIPDDLLVVLVGDMITEEALPTYMGWLNRFEGAKDPTGTSDSGWGRWARTWTAEENRHGDVLNRYLYVTGRVDMRAVEETIQHLLRNGWNLDEAGAGHDPYVGFVYTSFQERATKISHRNVARQAQKAGDEYLHRICGIIAGDEGRHEHAYKTFMDRIFDLDPEGAMKAFAYKMKEGIVMPAENMDGDPDAESPDLFQRYANIAQKTGVYTAFDYADIIEHLLSTWDVPGRTGLSGKAAEAQEYLCDLPDRYRRLAERTQGRVQEKTHSFRWIHDRTV